jgi:hypothetical protein
LLVLQQFDKIGAELAIIGLRSMTTPIIGSQKPTLAFVCGQRRENAPDDGCHDLSPQIANS